MILVREISGLRFREDILRGVRLFAIVFAAILLCVAAYRILRAPSDVQGATSSAEAEQPSPTPAPDAAPVSETSAEVHPLVVPAPPPVGGAAAPKKIARPKTGVNADVPPPPPAVPTVARAHRAAPPSGKEFEASNAVALPAPPVEDVAPAKPLTPKQLVGYKSLIEANANRLPADPTAVPIDDSPEEQAKGNRFFKAIGKIFHPGAKKETEPLTLRPKQ
jgi:hypothetical protein